MVELTPEQMRIKIQALTRENSELRDALLDATIIINSTTPTTEETDGNGHSE